MKLKITVLAALILTGILSIGGIGIGIMNLTAFCAVQTIGVLLSQLAKRKPSRAGIKFLVSAALCIAFLMLGTNRRYLWSLYFMLTLPACGLSALLDCGFWLYEKINACIEE